MKRFKIYSGRKKDLIKLAVGKAINQADKLDRLTDEEKLADYILRLKYIKLHNKEIKRILKEIKC